MKGFVFSVIKSPLRFAFFSARNPLVAAVVLLGSSSPLPRVHPFIQVVSSITLALPSSNLPLIFMQIPPASQAPGTDPIRRDPDLT
uniref:Uncharacterized protein n=1 Tax=Oryza punctata TaxID=4537 RepID=A0A0E0KXE0_ORYPU